jgi:hypothetical protein
MPGTLNVYAYALSNPLRLSDPSGTAATTDEDGGGACKRVSTCGSPIRQIADAVLDEKDAADKARESSNPIISFTGWAEETAAVVAVGAITVAAGAYVVGEALPTFLVTSGMAEGVPFAGAGTRVALRAAGGLAAKYGGQAANWAHYTTTGYVELPFGGPTIQIHWFEEVVEGIVAGAKFKFQ